VHVLSVCPKHRCKKRSRKKNKKTLKNVKNVTKIKKTFVNVE